MRFSLLLPAALLALSGCVSVNRAPEPTTTTVVTPVPPAPVTTDTTTTTTKRWSN
jgi:hypothetical protein